MKVKCYGSCEQRFEKEQMTKIKGQNHCPECYQKVLKENEDRQVLYNTVQKIFQVPFPTGMMLRQIKTFKEERAYTYEGMTMTLCYIVKVLQTKLNTRGGLAMIPYCYDQAIKYYADLEEKRKNTGDIDCKVITVKISPLKLSTDEIKNKVFVNMGGLE
ncbi:MAG TPA: hypothetical protein VK190_04835 [Pseudoneobacillus sp.]|nr:hypothetical protein [Pseudoneobacillus sp.]